MTYNIDRKSTFFPPFGKKRIFKSVKEWKIYQKNPFRHERLLTLNCLLIKIISWEVIFLSGYPKYNENIKFVVCQNIKKYRKEKGVRLMDLAEKLDLSVNHLKRIESVNDRNNISLITLYKISIILDVRIDRFFEEWV